VPQIDCIEAGFLRSCKNDRQTAETTAQTTRQQIWRQYSIKAVQWRQSAWCQDNSAVTPAYTIYE